MTVPVFDLPERLMPLASDAGVHPYVGDIHNHCNLSYGHGSLSDALENARRQLDFVSITGHAYWPDMPVDDPSVAHIVDFHVKGFARLKDQWPGHFNSLAAYNQPGTFTVFPGYEIHSNAHGDYTVVLRDLDQQQLLMADTPAELLASLRASYGQRAFAFPHHIGYRTGARGINWDSFNEDLSPVLEMISMHGCSETSLTTRPFLHSMGPSDGVNTVHHGLNSGHIFGVLGNTDHHSGYPGSYGHGRSVIYATENTSAALWEAIHARQTNALTGDNCHLFAMLNGEMQGALIAPSKQASLEIEAVGGSFIDSIDVIKNGDLAQRISPVLSPAPIDKGDDMIETIVVLELGWGARGSFQDWRGHLSLQGGDILAVEPRLRGPEVVSPLEGSEMEEPGARISLDGNMIRFQLRSHANPNNATATTQAVAARIRISADAVLQAELNGQQIEVGADRLFQGALSGNMGEIDTPAFRFHPLPRPSEWQWRGRMCIGELARGDWLMVRLRQSNGQMAWTSPFFCR